jgi:HlyD family secretion protein
MIPHQEDRWLLSISSRMIRASLAACAVLLAGVAGCKKPSPPSVAAEKVPKVAVVSPARTSLHWTVEQPGDIATYEETPIVPKIAGYVRKWNVDIGDHVRKGEVLAVLWVPDMVAELNQKKIEVEQARKMYEVAEAHVAATAAQIAEAKAGLRRAEANSKYWRLQYDRITQLTDQAVINKQVKEENWSRLESAEAGVKEAEAKVAYALADRKESEAARNKSRVDIAVAQAAQERMESMVDYATLSAAFDGVVSRRSINTGDFVKPPTAVEETPLYVVQRRDLMRVFVEVPEADAVWVKTGTPAQIRIPILKDRQYRGNVTRMSYSLKRQSRTLLAEIDLPNPEDLLRPGMYAYAGIQVERTNVLTLPASAVASQGNVNEGYQDFCFLLENGKVRRTFIEVGSRGDERVQVLKKQVHGSWQEFDGDELVVRGELATLADGQEVAVATNPGEPIRISRTARGDSFLGARPKAPAPQRPRRPSTTSPVAASCYSDEGSLGHVSPAGNRTVNSDPSPGPALATDTLPR